MAKPPKLITDADDSWKIRGSFPNGRYRFSLRSGAASLLTGDLGYGENDVVPWRLFRILVFTGDAWLPEQNAGQVDTGNDLVVPDDAEDLSRRDARALADHLERRRFGDDVRDALAAEIESTALEQFVDPADLPRKEEWVAEMARLVESGTADPADRPESSTNTESTDAAETPSVRLLHVGRATLGRRNMGRSERIQDYRTAFRHAIDVAVERDVTAVLQTGGLFQSRSPGKTTVEDCRRELERLRDHDIPFYLVFGRQEAEAKTDHLTRLASDGLVDPIGGRSVTLGDRVVLHGVDAGEPAAVARQSADCEADRDAFVAYAAGGADASAPQRHPFETIAANAPTAPNVYLTGRRTDPAWAEGDGVPIVDPGATENVLSKTTFGEKPVDRGVYEYAIAEGSFSVQRHEIPVRPFETLEFDLGVDSELADVRQRVADVDLSGKAVLCRLEGEKTDGAVERKAVQRLLAERSHCARVYDERTVVEPAEVGETSAARERFDGVAVADESASYLATMERVDELDPEDLSHDELVDLYALSSKVRSVAEAVRRDARDRLVERVPEGETATGDYGSVEAHRRESRKLKDDSEIFEALDRAGIPRETVLTRRLDEQKVEELLEEGEPVREADLYEQSESRYVTRKQLDVEGLGERRAESPDR